MNLEKVIFGFFVMLAARLSFGFVIGAFADAALPEYVLAEQVASAAW